MSFARKSETHVACRSTAKNKTNFDLRVFLPTNASSKRFRFFVSSFACFVVFLTAVFNSCFLLSAQPALGARARWWGLTLEQLSRSIKRPCSPWKTAYSHIKWLALHFFWPRLLRFSCSMPPGHNLGRCSPMKHPVGVPDDDEVSHPLIDTFIIFGGFHKWWCPKWMVDKGNSH